MNHIQKRKYLIQELLKEKPEYQSIVIPEEEEEQKSLLRSLMNVRSAAPISPNFELIQNQYLQEVNHEKGVIRLTDINERQKDLYLWQGDITRLGVDAIVNAANSGMTGCYRPCHCCIDNCIHTFAGIQLRNYCQKMMDQQGYEEPTGQAKITPAFNLPCKYVIHTVGPIVEGRLTKEHERQLKSCYESCLKIADEHQVTSLAFCCISTGVFGFPQQRAAEIAVSTVKSYQQEHHSSIKVIFNVFKEEDKQIYERILSKNSTDSR